MGLQRTIWLRQILKDFYATNAFLNFAQNWDEYVIDGIQTVSIPVEGAGSAISRNRSSLPATIAQRTDTELTYTMTNYTTDPALVTNLDQLQMSYDKMASRIAQDMALIKQAAAEDMLYAWRAEVAAAIVRTSGASIAAPAGATGTRKALTLMDLVTAAKVMDDSDIPEEGRYAMLTPQMVLDLASDPDVKAIGLGTTLMNYNSLKTPPQLAGFNILKRSKVLRYTNAATPVAKLPSAAAAATDNEAALCWSQYAVGRSMGNNQVYYNANKAEYYGSIFSMEINAGGRKISKSTAGVIGIVQTLLT